MKFSKNTLLTAIAAAVVMAAPASAQLKVGAVGSSAMFQTATIEAYQEAAAACGCTPGYFTAKNNAAILDQRGDSNIVPQVGNLSVVWDNPVTPVNVWYYLSVDSVVGNRAFFSTPRAHLGNINNTPANGVISNVFFLGINPVAIPAAVLAVINNSAFTAAFTDIRPEDALFAELRANCGPAQPGSPAVSLGCLGYGTADPFAGSQILSGSSLLTGAQAQPVAFNIFGSDPISGQAVPAFSTYPVGVAPITFIVNRTDTAGLGAPPANASFGPFCVTGMTYQGTPVLLFAGMDLNGTAFDANCVNGNNASGTPAQSPIYAVQREPISGTMNTFEFNVMLPNWEGPNNASPNDSVQQFFFSQEGCLFGFIPNFFALPQPQNNPLGFINSGGSAVHNAANNCPTSGNGFAYGTGGQGFRIRAIGTGELVNQVKALPDSIGYTFFSFGNVSAIAGSPNWGYLTYETWNAPGLGTTPADPLKPANAGGAPSLYGPAYSSPAFGVSPAGAITFAGNGELPVCAPPCQLRGGTSFANVRNGAYQQWSLLRAAGAPGDSNLTALTTGIANQVNQTAPDFIPFNPVGGSNPDPGLILYRSHFTPKGDHVAYPAIPFPNNGLDASGNYIGGEQGGDVGGSLNWRYPAQGGPGPNNVGGSIGLIGCRDDFDLTSSPMCPAH